MTTTFVLGTDRPITYLAAEAGLSVEDCISKLYAENPEVVYPEWESDFIGFCTIG